MSQAPHLNLTSPVQNVDRRDFYLADPTLLNPNNANPIIDGEWLSLNSSGKLVRGAGTLAGLSFQVFAEKGRYDTQPIGKVPLLFLGTYEAETDVYTSTGLVVGDLLVVGDVTVGGLTKKGLIECPAGAGSYMVVGFVTRVLTDKIRFIKLSPFVKTNA